MSRLQLHGRPWVVFNSNNKEHRRWFADFNKTGAWGRCPVRFVIDNDHGDLITQIQRELIAHYVTKEFSHAETQQKTATISRTPVRKSIKIDRKLKR